MRLKMNFDIIYFYLFDINFEIKDFDDLYIVIKTFLDYISLS